MFYFPCLWHVESPQYTLTGTKLNLVYKQLTCTFSRSTKTATDWQNNKWLLQLFSCLQINTMFGATTTAAAMYIISSNSWLIRTKKASHCCWTFSTTWKWSDWSDTWTVAWPLSSLRVHAGSLIKKADVFWWSWSRLGQSSSAYAEDQSLVLRNRPYTVVLVITIKTDMTCWSAVCDVIVTTGSSFTINLTALLISIHLCMCTCVYMCVKE